jgi:hypothetical protein
MKRSSDKRIAVKKSACLFIILFLSGGFNLNDIISAGIFNNVSQEHVKGFSIIKRHYCQSVLYRADFTPKRKYRMCNSKNVATA